MKTKIGILYICTGNYTIFWKEFYLSMEKNFITDAEKHYFVFTDSSKIDFEDENPNIHRIHQRDLGWPDNTLKRFHIFLSHEKELREMDYLFFLNANLLVLKNITAEEFLPKGGENLVVTLHPGFYNKKRSKFTYEKNSRSTAFIPKSEGTHYFAGGLNGGKTQAFVDAMKKMREQVDIDEKNGVIAKWHDESHWNRYLIDRNDVKILQPAYLYPEGWSLPFEPIILIRDKNKYGGHNLLRKESDTFLGHFIKKLRGVISTIIKKVPNIKNLIMFPYVKKVVMSQGIKLEGAPLLIVTIAYNNSEILKIQYKYLKENLEEDFIYMIADNSGNLDISREVEGYCQNEKIPYVKLPHNPYLNSSKSHGLALNWVYRNIVKKYKPTIFGFIDHDIFPYKTTSITRNIKQGIFGLTQERGHKWYLWPGFCFYDFKKIEKFNLNFMPSSGLDTGGANYYIFYKGIHKNTLPKTTQVYIDTGSSKIVPNVNNANTSTTIECIGDWVHLMRVSNWNSQKNDKISRIEEIVSIVKKMV